VIATVPAPGSGVPMGVAVTPDGEKVYVANLSDNSVSVINTATNTVRDAIGHAGVGTRTVNIQNGLLAGTGTAPRSAIAPPR
jgi:YVTN family beta-propeller protein